MSHDYWQSVLQAKRDRQAARRGPWRKPRKQLGWPRAVPGSGRSTDRSWVTAAIHEPPFGVRGIHERPLTPHMGWKDIDFMRSVLGSSWSA